jgi:ubiquinone/menaquinone biosynthesis C-methylase UbiE
MAQTESDSRKEWSRQSFSDVAAGFDQSGANAFARLGGMLVEQAGISAGMRVLDVGSGRGAVLIPAANAVGPQGQAVGIDLAEGMVAATGSELTRRGVQNAEIRVMDAEDLHFPDDSFDAVLSGFALMFFPHLDRALAEFRRVLIPDGTLAVSTFQTLPPTTAINAIVEAYRDTTLGLLPQTLDRPEALESALRSAGFGSMTVSSHSIEVIHADVDAYWAWVSSLLVGVWLRTQPADIQTRFEADARAHLRDITQPDGIHETMTALFAVSHR